MGARRTGTCSPVTSHSIASPSRARGVLPAGLMFGWWGSFLIAPRTPLGSVRGSPPHNADGAGPVLLEDGHPALVLEVLKRGEGALAPRGGLLEWVGQRDDALPV